MSNHNQAELGLLSAEYKKSWALPIVLFLLFAFPAYLLIAAGLSNNDSFIPLLSGFALLAPCLFAILDRARYRVQLYENGIVVRGLLGEKTVFLRPSTKIWYSTTKEYVNGIPAGTHINLKIEDDAKKAIRIRSSVRNIDELHSLLTQFEQDVIGPELIAAYSSGKSADFSALKLKKGRIFLPSKSMDASKIARIELEGGILSIWQDGQRSPFCRIRTSDIANLYTFIGILPAIAPVGEPQYV